MSAVYVFDLDDTLWDGKKLYPDVRNILHYLRANGHLVFIATFNSKGPNILRSLGIDHLFHGGVYGPQMSKCDMLQAIKKFSKKYQIKEKWINFYDDLPANVLEVRLRDPSVNVVHIKNGLTWSHIK